MQSESDISRRLSEAEHNLCEALATVVRNTIACSSGIACFGGFIATRGRQLPRRRWSSGSERYLGKLVKTCLLFLLDHILLDSPS